jgi:hypothetical protein
VSAGILTQPCQTLDRPCLRLQVARHQARLDAALAQGADPADDPTLALCAQQLTRSSTRRAIANTLRNVLDAAEEPPDTWPPGGPRPPLQRADVLAARYDLRALADRLSQPGDASVGAVALGALPVWDPTSPLSAERTDTSVAEWPNTMLDTLRTT